MGMKRRRFGRTSKIGAIVVFFFLVAGVGATLFKTDLLISNSSNPVQLSGLVSVRGAVSLEQLDFSRHEVVEINEVVHRLQHTFTRVDMLVDIKEAVDKIDDSTILVFALSLQTNGDLEVKSWSRKLPRSKLVDQMVSYMLKAAKEYEEFQKFPDVKQKFKTLYI